MPNPFCVNEVCVLGGGGGAESTASCGLRTERMEH